MPKINYTYRKMRKLVFTLVIENGSITSSEVAEITGRELSVASHLLSKLHYQNWLRRRKVEGRYKNKYIYSPSKLLLEKYDSYMELPDDYLTIQ